MIDEMAAHLHLQVNQKETPHVDFSFLTFHSCPCRRLLALLLRLGSPFVLACLLVISPTATAQQNGAGEDYVDKVQGAGLPTSLQIVSVARTYE